jgi:hypothetical protein
VYSYHIGQVLILAGTASFEGMCKCSSRMALIGERSRPPVHNIARISAVPMNDQPDDAMAEDDQ